ncbi:hypothetical protein BC835DRAFT_1473704 [Cytidiella melzeri]|nr:hypothetical protein BC835DRAFT_1473704 [Cytidiella melzeri]
MALFMEQAKDVNIIITTGLILGKPAPKLITEKVLVSAIKQGSVIVNLAAKTDGNCKVTKPGELYKGVTIIGYTDLPSRLPTQSSTLYSSNITKFLLSIGPGHSTFAINLSDEVILPLTPRPTPLPVAAPVTSKEPNMVAISLVVWGVAPVLHLPLMLVTNAISGMAGIGGLYVMGGEYTPGTIPQVLGALSVLLASVNVAGGFVITKRMLDMFKGNAQTHGSRVKTTAER